MRSAAPLVLIAIALVMLPGSAWAQKGGHAAAKASSGTVHDRSYDKKDGTHVEGYDRGPHAAGDTPHGALAKQTAAPTATDILMDESCARPKRKMPSNAQLSIRTAAPGM